jgi:RHS repeat-associated protein
MRTWKRSRKVKLLSFFLAALTPLTTSCGVGEDLLSSGDYGVDAKRGARRGGAPDAVAVAVADAEGELQASFPSPVTNTGAFEQAIPIPIWPGVGEMTPELGLRYSNQAGIGAAGVGWHMAYPAITINSAEGFRPGSIAVDVERFAPHVPVKRYTSTFGTLSVIRDNADYESSTVTYVLDPHGDQKVEPIDDEHGAPNVGGDKAAWLMTTKNGTKYRFGYTDQASLFRDEGAQSTERKVGWFLDQVEDRNGNLMKYFYEQYPGRQIKYRQPVLRAIEYGIPARAVGTDDRMVVLIDYIQSPSWKRFSMNAGTRVDFAYLVDRICNYAKAAVSRDDFSGRVGWTVPGIEAPGPTLSKGRCVELTYNFEEGSPAAYTGRPLLTKVQEVAPDGSKLPPWEMTYSGTGGAWQTAYQQALAAGGDDSWSLPETGDIDRGLQYSTQDLEHMTADVNGDGAVDVIDGRSDGVVDVYLGGKQGLSAATAADDWRHPLSAAQPIDIVATEKHFGENSGSACWYEADVNLGWAPSGACPGGNCLGYARGLTSAPDDYWHIFDHDSSELEQDHRPLGAFQFLRSSTYGPYPAFGKRDVANQARTIDELESYGSNAKDKNEHAFDFRTTDCRDWQDRWEQDFCWNVGPRRDGMLGADHSCLDMAAARWFTDDGTEFSRKTRGYSADLWELRDMDGDLIPDMVFAAPVIAQTQTGLQRDFAAGDNDWYWSRGTGSGWGPPVPWHVPSKLGASFGLESDIDFIHATQVLSVGVSTTAVRPKPLVSFGLVGSMSPSIGPSVSIAGVPIGLPSFGPPKSLGSLGLSMAGSGAAVAHDLLVQGITSGLDPRAAVAVRHVAIATRFVVSYLAGAGVLAWLPLPGFRVDSGKAEMSFTALFFGDLLAYVNTQNDVTNTFAYQGMADLDGDARPDLISARWDAGADINDPDRWLFYHNNGAGFDDPQLFHFAQAPATTAYAAGGISGGASSTFHKGILTTGGQQDLVFGTDEDYYGLVDLNGDGLADFVDSHDWEEPDENGVDRQVWWVHFNEGDRFGSPSKWEFRGNWDTDHGPAGCSRVYSHPRISQTVFGMPSYANNGHSYNRQVQGTFDVDGDGLLDYWYEEPYLAAGAGSSCGYVTSISNFSDGDALRPYVEPYQLKRRLLVRRNTGFGFDTPVEWVGGNGFALSGGESDASITDVPPEPRSDVVLGTGDFDNDGVVELAVRDRNVDDNNDDGDDTSRFDWKLYDLGVENPDAMTGFTNPYGGHIAATYKAHFEPADRLPAVQWVVDTVTASDIDASRPPITHTYTYEHGVFDREERIFLGFERIYDATGSGYTMSRYYTTEGFNGNLYCREVRDLDNADSEVVVQAAAHTAAWANVPPGGAPSGHIRPVAVGRPLAGSAGPIQPPAEDGSSRPEPREEDLGTIPDTTSPWSGPPEETEPDDTDETEQETWNADGPAEPPPADYPSQENGQAGHDGGSFPPVDTDNDEDFDLPDTNTSPPGDFWDLPLDGDDCEPGENVLVDGIVYYCDDEEITPELLGCGHALDKGTLVQQEYTIWGDRSGIRDLHAPKLRAGATFLYDKDGVDPQVRWWSNELDVLGNVVQLEDLGDVDLAGDEMTITTEFAVAPNRYLAAFPCHVRATEGTAASPGELLRETMTGYDGGAAGSCTAPTKGNPTTVSRAVSDTETVSEELRYNEEGLVWLHTDGRGLATTSAYNPSFPWLKVLETQLVVTTGGPLLLTKAWTHFGASDDQSTNFGQVYEAIDPNGAKTTYRYDGFERVVGVHRPLEGILLGEIHGFQDWEPTAPSQPLRPRTHTVSRKVILGGGFVDKTTSFDGWGRNIRTDGTPPDNRAGCAAGSCTVVTSEQVLDEHGRVTDLRTPYFSNRSEVDARIQTTYDLLGRPTTVIGLNGAATQTEYDREKVTSQGPDGQVSLTELDARGKQRFVHSYMNGGAQLYATTEYRHDALGQLETLIDDAGNTWSFGYDRMGRKTFERDPNAGDRTYAYDASGNLAVTTDGRYAETGLATRMLHDPLGRVSARFVLVGATVDGSTVIGGTPLEMSVWSYDVDPGTLPDPTITDCADSWRGRLSRVDTYRVVGGVQKLVSRKDHCYDARGRVLQEHRTIDGARYEFAHAYNLLDAVTSTTFPDGDVVTYGYDSAGRMASVSSAAVGSILASSRVGADGLPAERALGNGVLQRFCYQDGVSGRQLRRAVTGKTGLDLDCIPDVVTGPVLLDSKYQYSDGGRVVAAAGGYEDPLAGWTEHDSTYQYDDLDRLTSEAYDSPLPTSSYVFDTIGNLTSKDGIGQSYGNAARSTRRAGPNAIHATAGGWRLHYDAVGNVERLEAGTTYRMTYDARNRVQTVRSGPTLLSELWYDEAGARVKEVKGADTTTYVGPYQVSSSKTETFYPGLGAKVTDAAGTKLYLTVRDPRNSTSLVLNAIGAPIKAVTYDPWGAVRENNTMTGAWSTDYLYNDKQRQSVFGDLDVFDYGPRLYLADVGRWLGVDPGFADGPNRYTYVRNDPINNRDPTGEFTVPILDGIDAHQAISSHFRQYHPNAEVDVSLGKIMKDYQAPTPFNILGSSRRRPDIYDRPTGDVYEIKPLYADQIAAGVLQVAGYVRDLQLAGLPAQAGPWNAPQTFGIVQGNRGFYLYFMPFAGVIAYKKIDESEYAVLLLALNKNPTWNTVANWLHDNPDSAIEVVAAVAVGVAASTGTSPAWVPAGAAAGAVAAP